MLTRRPVTFRIASRRLEVRAGLAPRLRDPVRLFQLFQPSADLSGLSMVVVDAGIAHPLVRLGVRALELLDEVVECRRHVGKATCGR